MLMSAFAGLRASPTASVDRAMTAGRSVSDASHRTALNDRYALGMQRSLDVAIASAALSFFALLLPLLALAIKLDSRGSVFYSQTRIGLNRRRRKAAHPVPDRRKTLVPGRPFRVWKLRTMVCDAERNGPRWAARNDDRVTRTGRFLRRSRLDEVPQFWNVLRGEMSVVGPRPERLCFVNQFERDVPFYRERLLVRPGITGLAQIENGYDCDLESVRRKVALDRRYIREIGLWTDLRILARTVRVVLRGSGAH
ncbi:MAG: sugar transferase [Candidatus Krumholzibacteria bacterium]|jgi:lipopolysaccharide/colanic/teichoic acid biosynthesis glycosyltransferase|nr:sugar transferase [Candidatus Krumholzibacteria bacterium]